MKQLVLKPNGWPCTLEECPPGIFVCGENIGFKSEYSNDKTEAFCESGEYFCAGDDKIVQPVTAEWIDEEGGDS